LGAASAGYPARMPKETVSGEHQHDHGVLEAFNAERLVEHPNDPAETEGGPADDSDTAPPG